MHQRGLGDGVIEQVMENGVVLIAYPIAQASMRQYGRLPSARLCPHCSGQFSMGYIGELNEKPPHQVNVPNLKSET